MTRILIVDDSAFNLKIASAALAPAGYDIATAGSGREALERVDEIQPDLFILDVMMPDLSGYDVCRRLRQKHTTMHRPIMMLTANDTLEERVNGFDAGADDYMIKPFEPAELQARVKALLRRFAPTQVEPEVASLQGKVIAVFSLRGGIGVSTLATNLAVGLAQIWGQPTALVDLALTSGQSALMLNLPLRNSWADLARVDVNEIDAALLEPVLLTHPSGVRVLATSARPEQSELITAEKVGHVMGLLRGRYEYVVLDLPHDFSEPTLAGLDTAHQILTMLAPELASVRAAACALEVFGHLNYPRDTTALVLNATFERGGLARKDIESALKHPITLSLPFAPEQLLSAINRGIPPVAELPNKPIGIALEDCAFFVSKEDQRKQRPAQPSAAWQRVAHRSQQRRQQRAS
ncbi:MAG: response regulator [Roseiflexaceae bacterium]